MRTPFRLVSLAERGFSEHTNKKERPSKDGLSFWLGCRDSNPGNVRVRV